MKGTFPDNFSRQSLSYAAYRPTYPPELFAYLSGLTKEHALAWDCATGNGQSANGLAQYYDHVYATDPSKQQLSNAVQHSRITYRAEKAEECNLPNVAADIITVAQALHWFQFDAFYAQVQRVLKEDGVLAVWAYGLPVISHEVDAVINYFHDEIVGKYWQRENRLIEDEYASIPFPFKQVQTPAFEIKKQLSLNHIFGLLDSWSAVHRYMDVNKTNPISVIEKDLSKAWNESVEMKIARWKLVLKVGRKAHQ